MSIDGFVDGFTDGVLNGWVANRESEDPVTISLCVDGAEVSQHAPDHVREDIVAIYGAGIHGFRFKSPALDNGFQGKQIAIFVRTDKAEKKLDIPQHILEKINQDTNAEKARAIAHAFIKQFENIPINAVIKELANSDTFDYNEKAVLLHAANSFTNLHHVPESRGSSPVRLASGMRSADTSISLGREGWIFLEEGSNQIRSQYERSEQEPAVKDTIRRWKNVCRNRETLCGSTKYIQLCLPEKSSVVGKYAVPAFSGATPIFSLFEKEIGQLSSYLSVFADMTREDESEKWFYKTDTHLSNVGAHSLISLILQHLNLPIEPVEWHTEGRLHCGDVSRRLLGVPLYEEELTPASPLISDTQRTRQHTSIYHPPTGGHIGTKAELLNDAAPHDQRVLVFGNSFFDIGVADFHLTWWLSLYFKHVKFVWTPEFVPEEASSYQPDLIICQTIERFLTRAPEK